MEECVPVVVQRLLVVEQMRFDLVANGIAFLVDLLVDRGQLGDG